MTDWPLPSHTPCLPFQLGTRRLCEAHLGDTEDSEIQRERKEDQLLVLRIEPSGDLGLVLPCGLQNL